MARAVRAFSQPPSQGKETVVPMHPYTRALPQQPSLYQRRLVKRGLVVLAFVAALIIAAMFHVV
jgi:hypothetical protein